MINMWKVNENKQNNQQEDIFYFIGLAGMLLSHTLGKVSFDISFWYFE